MKRHGAPFPKVVNEPRSNPMSLSTAIRLMNRGYTTRIIFYFRWYRRVPSVVAFFAISEAAYKLCPPFSTLPFPLSCRRNLYFRRRKHVRGVSRTASCRVFRGPVYKSVIQHAIKCSTRWKVGVGVKERDKEVEQGWNEGRAREEEDHGS